MKLLLLTAVVILLAGCANKQPLIPSSAPAETAQSVAQPSSSYAYRGCTVYPANDWFTTNLITGGSAYASNQVDSNSANIIAHLSNAYPTMYLDEANPRGSVTVNLATSGTPKTTVHGTKMLNDPYDDDPNNVVPVTSPFYVGGSANGSCSGDCQAIVLNTQTCVDYETYTWGAPWLGGTYRASGGFVHNLRHPLNSQYMDGGGVTAAGMPLLGMTDLGEDASSYSINHSVDLSLPGSGASPNATGGAVAPAVPWHPCASNCTNKLPLGARLRLKSSYACPSQSAYRQSYLVCNQLKTYGAIFVDWNGSSGRSAIMELRFGTSSNGSNPWSGKDLYYGLKNITIRDFDVMKLGTIH